MKKNITLLKADRNSTIDLHINPVFKGILFFTCSWIIIAHSAIVYCFIINRSKPWTKYSKLILSLSINDLTAGFACLCLLLINSIEGEIYYIACYLPLYLIIAAASANLYHVFAICVYRAMILTKKPANTTPASTKLSVLLAMLAWIASFCLCAVPFILWAQQRQYVPSCHFEYVVGEQMKTATGFFGSCKILPMLLINTVYIIICWKLRAMWRKIATGTAATSNPTMIHNMSHSNISGVKAQRQAIVTIGLLLFFFNLASIPLACVLCAEYYGHTFPQNVRALTSNLFIMNSATSPFVYAIRTKSLRNAMKDMVNRRACCASA